MTQSTVPVRDDDGYYHMPDGRKLLSVTNIIELGVPKPNLVHWSAWEVARCAMEWLPRLARARGEEARYEALKWLQKAAERKRDDAADLGTAIHDAVEAHILGNPWPEPTDEQRPFVDAFARFCGTWQPKWEAAEMVLANYTDGWAGTGDAWFRIVLPWVGPEPVLVLADWKTGKNVYPEVGMQLSAYRRAEVGFLKDGTQVVPPTVEHTVVVHLRPEKYSKTGGYRIRPVDTSDAVYAQFRHAQATAEGWVRGLSTEVLGKAYGEPRTTQRKAS